MKKRRCKLFLPGLLLCCLAALLPVLMLCLPNMAEISFRDMLPYIGFMLLIGLLAWAAMNLMIRRRKGFAALTAALWLLVLLNVGRLVPVIHTVNSQIGIRVIGPAVLVFLAAMTFGLSRLKEELLRDAVKVLSLALAAVILTSAVTGFISGGEQPEEEAEGTVAATERIDVRSAENTSRPNIYWIVADEYAGFQELEKYYHYDNSPFYNWLREKGFTVSEGSYNWSSSTFSILRDILNLGYRGKEERDKHEIVADPDQRFWNVLRDLGYGLYEAESNNKFRLANRLREAAGDTAPRTADGDAVPNLLLQYSILYRWENAVIDCLIPSLSKASAREAILDVLEWAEDPEHYRTEEACFSFIYVQCPHAPFFFDSEGNPVPEEHQTDFKDHKYYLGQMNYISGRLQTVCDTIIREDPGAVIVLQSDHGMRQVPNITKLDQTNILNAVYFHGEPLDDIVDANALNTWITILNTQFNLDISPVEEKRLPDEYRKKQRDPEAEDPNGESA